VLHVAKLKALLFELDTRLAELLRLLVKFCLHFVQVLVEHCDGLL